MRSLRRFVLLAPLFLLVSACGAPTPPRYEITYTDPLYNPLDLRRDGLAMAPVDPVKPILGGAGALATMSNELYTALLTFTEKVEVVDPEVVLQRAKKAGEDVPDSLRQFQRRRIQKAELSPAECSKIFPWLATRFLLVPWVEESGQVEMKEGPTIDYTDIDFSQDIYAVTYQRYEGTLTAELIDLVRGEVVWRAVVRYSTGEMYKDNLPADLWTQRNRACVAMAKLLNFE